MQISAHHYLATADQLRPCRGPGLSFNVIKTVLLPFRAKDDDYFALACDVSLVFVLIFTMFIKIIGLTDSEVGSTRLISVLSETVRDEFYISSFWLTVGLFTGVVSILSFLSIVAARQIASEWYRPRTCTRFHKRQLDNHLLDSYFFVHSYP